MDKARLAEWILTRFISPQRAAEVVGDLTEQQATGTLMLLTAVRVAVAFHWRSLLAVPAGWAAFMLLYGGYLLVARHFMLTLTVTRRHGKVLLPSFPRPWTAEYLFFAELLLAVTALCWLRYGGRSSIARSAATMCAFTFLAACSGFLPGQTNFAPWMVSITAVSLLLYAPTRRSFFCVIAATAALFVASDSFASRVHAFWPTMPWAAQCSLDILFGVIAAALVLHLMQRWLVPLTPNGTDAGQGQIIAT